MADPWTADPWDSRFRGEWPAHARHEAADLVHAEELGFGLAPSEYPEPREIGGMAVVIEALPASAGTSADYQLLELFPQQGRTAHAWADADGRYDRKRKLSRLRM